MSRYKKTITSVTEELQKKGLTFEHANIVATCFVTADLYGVETHGTAVLPAHIARIERGGYNLSPQFKVLRETAAFACVDGDNAMGPISAEYCMRYAMDKARSAGIFTVLSNNNNTFGPGFYYPLLAAEEGLIGFICSNSPAQMAPSGGKEKMLGTNPFAMVVPVDGENPIIVDMATSVVAKSKFNEYKKNNQPLPDGWALDEDGVPTNDPDEAIRGLVMPMAGYKGAAISMLIDILAGALSGAAVLNHVGRFYSPDNKSMNVGFYMVVIDPKLVLGDEYGKIISSFVTDLRMSNSVDGAHIYLPGDGFHKRRAYHETPDDASPIHHCT